MIFFFFFSFYYVLCLCYAVASRRNVEENVFGIDRALVFEKLELETSRVQHFQILFSRTRIESVERIGEASDAMERVTWWLSPRQLGREINRRGRRCVESSVIYLSLVGQVNESAGEEGRRIGASESGRQCATKISKSRWNLSA